MRNKLTELERDKIMQLAPDTLFDDSEVEYSEALDYLITTRKFRKDVIKLFEIGYMPKNVLNDTGRFHELAGRILFPIRNHYKELVAFTTRDWRPGAKNSHWHESFPKGQYLYGLHLTKDYIVKAKKVILVEGQFDVMQLYQHGLKCVVGLLGSAPQLYQIALLSRYCKEIFAFFDADEAGKAALKRLKELVKKFKLNDFDIHIIPVYLPEGYDPDEYIKGYGVKQTVGLLKESKTNYYEAFLC